MFNFFTADQVKSLARYAMVAGGTYFVKKGYVDNAFVTEVAGAGAMVVAAIWSLVFHAGSNKADLEAVVAGEADAKTEAKVFDKVMAPKYPMGK